MNGQGAPPGRRIGPATLPGRPDTTHTSASSVDQSGNNRAQRHRVCIHARPVGRFCQPCVTRRRRVAFLLDELLADLHPGRSTW